MSYFFLSESIRLNGQRHKLKGDMHAVLGRPGFAAGSYLKAIRNEVRAIELESLFRRRPRLQT